MTNKTYTLEDFATMCLGEKVIEASGTTGKYGINTSSILSKLIYLAGRYCDNYASDLFISWKKIEEKLEKFPAESSSELFGFRDAGVDHTEFVLARYNNQGAYGAARYEYRHIYRLDIIAERDDYLRLRLFEVDKSI